MCFMKVFDEIDGTDQHGRALYPQPGVIHCTSRKRHPEWLDAFDCPYLEVHQSAIDHAIDNRDLYFFDRYLLRPRFQTRFGSEVDVPTGHVAPFGRNLPLLRTRRGHGTRVTSPDTLGLPPHTQVLLDDDQSDTSTELHTTSLRTHSNAPSSELGSIYRSRRSHQAQRNPISRSAILSTTLPPLPPPTRSEIRRERRRASNLTARPSQSNPTTSLSMRHSHLPPPSSRRSHRFHGWRGRSADLDLDVREQFDRIAERLDGIADTVLNRRSTAHAGYSNDTSMRGTSTAPRPSQRAAPQSKPSGSEAGSRTNSLAGAKDTSKGKGKARDFVVESESSGEQ